MQQKIGPECGTFSILKLNNCPGVSERDCRATYVCHPGAGPGEPRGDPPHSLQQPEQGKFYGMLVTIQMS